MQILNPAALFALSQVFHGIQTVHEHSGVPVELSLADDTSTYKMLGHHVLLEVPDIAVFLEYPEREERIELIQKGVPAHEAWLLNTQQDFGVVRENLRRHGEFKEMPNKHILDHLWAQMFRHRPTGGVMQIVWRQTHIYKNLFPKKMAKKK